MRIHREGHKIVFIAFVIFDLITFSLLYFFSEQIILLSGVLGVLLLCLLWIVHFFRNPKRVAEIHEDIVLCPADGKVVVIEKVYEPEFFKDERRQVSIFMSPLSVHVNRYPVSGEITYMKHHHGKYLVAWHPKSSTENERVTTVIRMKNGKEILVRQIAGIMARRIIPYSKEGLSVVQGNELGFIRFGSRVDLFLPLDTRLNVSIDDQVRGNINEIARLD